ncbi:hypothetical protein [Bacillus gobiensis]|uniref:hypothetical protein n=1 Tax=Bacillus gobiensis TaxID=1441095 RepID=UPI003D233168
MQAPKQILTTWRKFDDFPMETLSKAWFYEKKQPNRQRDITEMKEHRSQYGIAGNCFDLSIWLLDEFSKHGIEAYPIGHRLKTNSAHAAVIAIDENGRRYLCDLGDQWINPILIDSNSEDYSNEKQSGFFPAADVEVIPAGQIFDIVYYRPNGKRSQQTYHTEPIETAFFLEAAEWSQRNVKPNPLFECRIPYKSEIAHWEFDNWKSCLSTSEGLFHETTGQTVEDWADKISLLSEYDKQFLIEALEIYKKGTTWCMRG